jgi:hypothetical protein
MDQKENPFAMEHNRTCAIQLLTYKGKNHLEVIEALKERGMDEESASTMVLNIIKELKDEKQQQSKKDILHGVLWCLGGIVATYISLEIVFKDKPIGIFFWGAIIYGGYRFLKGLSNS